MIPQMDGHYDEENEYPLMRGGQRILTNFNNLSVISEDEEDSISDEIDNAPEASYSSSSEEEEEEEQDNIEEETLATAFGKSLRTFDYKPISNAAKKNLLKFLQYLVSKLKSKFPQLLSELKGFKFELTIGVEYICATDPTISTTGYLRTINKTVTNNFENDDILRRTSAQICERNANFMQGSSGFVIKEIKLARVNISKYNPLMGARYHDLPQFLQRKQAIINVRNNDNRCFGYAILSAFYPPRNNPQRSLVYDHLFQKEGLAHIDYPVEPLSVPQLEQQLQININVYEFFDEEGRGRVPMFISRQTFPRSVDLLYWKGHYAWIKQFSRFVFDVSKHEQHKYFCKRCLGHFVSQPVLDIHLDLCSHNDFTNSIFTLPYPGSICKFKNNRFQQRAPFVIYADFECLTTPMDQNLANGSGTNLYQHHIPCSVGFKLVSTFAPMQNRPYEQHAGKDVMEWFLKKMIELRDICLEYLFDPQRLVMTDRDIQRFNFSDQCYLCKKPFNHNNSDKVRDHDHLDGKFRGAAHTRCNILMRKSYKIPIFFHNFKGYDSHLIVKSLNKFPEMDITVIGQGMEKYIRLSWGGHLEFKDSMMFMNSSLERLTNNLSQSGKENFRYLLEEFEDDDPIDLLMEKSAFPYDWFNSWERFEELQLPPREAFHSKLKNSDCSVEAYNHAEEVWIRFDCQTFADYHDLYLKADVLQLTDIYETFRDVCLHNYGLDPAHYISAPQLSWDAMLKMTDIKLELISDPEMFSMIDGGIRGGVVMISKRYARANNKHLGPALYDSTKPSSYIIYLDANNLYGWAMRQTLPTHDFTWITEAEWEEIDWLSLSPDQEIGYFVECDLHYPEELHSLHNDYPLAPERLHIEADMLSENQVRIRRNYSMNRSTACTKLCPNLLDKKRYCCHYRNLQYYLEHGLKLIRIYRVLKFKQSKWLEPYIILNQTLRQGASNEFEKEFFKLMVNCIYGKTCENQKNRSDIKLVTDDRKRKKLTEKPHCRGFRIFDENLAAIDMRHIQSRIDKPFYVGFSVLELSKLHMYRFHYDYIKEQYGAKAQLLFTDTDSLMYEIETADIYEDMWADRDLFDLTNFPTTSKYHDSTNNKVIGKFKDESVKPILEWVGLRPKMYSFLAVDDYNGTTSNAPPTEKMRAKGISHAAAQTLHHSNFLKQLHRPEENYLINHRIASKLHNIYSLSMEKRALCAYDDKRFLLDDGEHTLAFGHCDIPTRVETIEVEDWGNDRNQVWTAEHARGIQRGSAHRPLPIERLDFPIGEEPAQTVAEARVTRSKATVHRGGTVRSDAEIVNNLLVHQIIASARDETDDQIDDPLLSNEEISSLIDYVKREFVSGKSVLEVANYLNAMIDELHDEVRRNAHRVRRYVVFDADEDADDDTSPAISRRRRRRVVDEIDDEFEDLDEFII